jgi:DNA segregation ATPase FtsK/SpoIIIE, S-DNA-T family
MLPIKRTSPVFEKKAANAIHPIRGLLYGLLALLILIALIDYDPSHNPYLSTAANEANAIGRVGGMIAFILLSWIGAGAWIIAGLGFFLAYRSLVPHPEKTLRSELLAVGGILIALIGLLSEWESGSMFLSYSPNDLPSPYVNGLGGAIGFVLYNHILADYIGEVGSAIILSALGLIALQGLMWRPGQFQKFLESYAVFKEKLRALFRRKPALEKKEPQSMAIQERALPKINRTSVAKAVVIEEKALPLIQNPPAAGAAKVLEEPKLAPEPIGKLKIIREQPTEKAKATALPVQRGKYIFPTLDLLTEAPPQQITDEDHEARAAALLETLSQFGVKVTLGEIHSGPVITRYEVTPAPGVRVEKIVSLDKNIALALKAISVRILAPVPGKGTVGIEIPNQFPAPVCLREIIESSSWANTNAEIPVVLGKEATGKPLVADLTKMPHLLIAGSTGAGKTVCINAVIASLVYHSSPDDLRFIMVDPKIVEMQIFNSLPHMLIPVVTNPKLVPGALKWLISEMETRYRIFAQIGVRNIAGFNAKILKNKEEEAKAAELDASLSAEERIAVSSIDVPRDLTPMDIPGSKLPYIVCIIDELADLMMVAPADIETCVARLAQLARAAGIHLILATQRPSVNVITGVIKANLPSRISFKVASKVDSRTILDTGGADQLIGRGDMLFLPPGSNNLLRAQGAFVSDEEIQAVVEFLKRNGPPIFCEDVQRQVEESATEEGNKSGLSGDCEWDDALVPKALDVLRSTKRASTSMLQRRLQIGYNRAARIMEILEEEGIVGPENGAKPREILQDLDLIGRN